MRWFNIVHVQIPDSKVTLAHWDIARLLFHSFESLGIKSTLQVNRLEKEAVNIVVGYERLNPSEDFKAIKMIPYQLEQLGSQGAELTSEMRSILKSATEVWDYSETNAGELRALGVQKVKILPIGFHEKLATIERREKEDVDVLFYGLLNERRQRILESLMAEGINVKTLQFVYGDERDAWIARSKIVLNIHFFEAKVSEQVRLSYLLNNRRAVVSEISPQDPFADFYTSAPYEDLPKTILKLLKDDSGRFQKAEAGFQKFSQHKMTDHLSRIINSISLAAI